MGEIREAVEKLIRAVGDDPSRPGLSKTPERIERLIGSFFTYRKKLAVMTDEERNSSDLPPDVLPITVFPNDHGFDDLIVKRGEYVSFCEHHLVPFHFKYMIALLPGEWLVGLSKLGDVVKYFAGRLQLQERLTRQVADWIHENIKPKGVMVVLKGRHYCEYLTRGELAEFTTSALRGRFHEDQALRMEALRLWD